MKRMLLGVASFFLAVPVTLWAWYHERRILRRGRELSNAEFQDARAVGVREPERLRILAVERVPNPLIRLSGIIERLTKFSIFAPAGMTLRYGIFVVASLERDRLLLAHEFVHVAQYERLGGRFGLLRRYVFQCLADGYLEAPLEVEARDLSDRVCLEP